MMRLAFLSGLRPRCGGFEYQTAGLRMSFRAARTVGII
jgi:hypothetical protein